MVAGVVITFREQGGVRSKQLKMVSDRIKELCTKHGQDYRIYVMVQDDGGLFYKSILINSAVDIYKKDIDYIIFQDVDNFPISEDNVYRYRDYTGNICGIIDGKRYGDRDDHFGDTTFFKKEDFIAINGYSNYYVGWGFESSNTPKRLKAIGIEFRRGDSVFETLPHDSKHRYHGNPNFVNNTLIYHLGWDLQNWEGLSNVQYTINKVTNVGDTTTTYIKTPPPPYEPCKILSKEWFKERLENFDEKMYDWCIKTYKK